jgi:hypothetical protein
MRTKIVSSTFRSLTMPKKAGLNRMGTTQPMENALVQSRPGDRRDGFLRWIVGIARCCAPSATFPASPYTAPPQGTGRRSGNVMDRVSQKHLSIIEKPIPISGVNSGVDQSETRQWCRRMSG